MATKYSHFTVAPVIFTVAPAISNSDADIYDRDSGFAELLATLDITSAFQLPEVIAAHLDRKYCSPRR